jgi:hypothetical protein
VNDHSEPRNGEGQQEEREGPPRNLDEQLDLLEMADRRLTPEHVARRFRELLANAENDGRPSAATAILKPEVLVSAAGDQPHKSATSPVTRRDRHTVSAGSTGDLSSRIPRHGTTLEGLPDFSPDSPDSGGFDAIVVPASRPVEFIDDSIGLAARTAVPLVVVCSKRVNRHQVIERAQASDIEVFAVDLPPQPLGGISFATSTDEALLAFTSGGTRDLSAKRNLGLVLARMLDWKRLMFLDDDIYGVSKEDVEALAAGLSEHSVSVLIPDEFPDNSIACHAYRLGGGQQEKFVSASSMGVRCDRDELPFFPNIYNEDWFFFSEEAAKHQIAEVGTSKRREYDPYADPQRAVKEEFGDLLAEGLYTRLDAGLDISSAGSAYWDEFIESRKAFLGEVADLLATRLKEEALDRGQELEIRAAQVSIREADHHLDRIDSALCQRFIDLWQADLIEWRHYLANLPRVDSVGLALEHLGLEYAEASLSPSVR